MRLWLALSSASGREIPPHDHHHDAAGGLDSGGEAGQPEDDDDEAEHPADADESRYGLTTRERGVLELLTEGKTDKEIAEVLDISPLTVHKHVSSILSKMGAHSRTEASTRALREGLVE